MVYKLQATPAPGQPAPPPELGLAVLQALKACPAAPALAADIHNLQRTLAVVYPQLAPLLQSAPPTPVLAHQTPPAPAPAEQQQQQPLAASPSDQPTQAQAQNGSGADPGAPGTALASAAEQGQKAANAAAGTQSLAGLQAQRAQFTPEVEKEAEQYFKDIYTGKMSVTECLALLSTLKDSANAREHDVFNCMIQNLFDEYRFFPKFPDKELTITSVLFGSLIQQQLIPQACGPWRMQQWPWGCTSAPMYRIAALSL
jgi:hypothetical protein